MLVTVSTCLGVFLVNPSLLPSPVHQGVQRVSAHVLSNVHGIKTVTYTQSDQ
jgi:hypothetical protein